MLARELRAGDQRGDLLLFPDLPVDEILDVRMVDVDDDHLGGAPRGAAGLDRAGGPVADLEEAHQAAGLAAAGQGLALAAQGREVGAGARAVFEQPRLAHPQIHDAAVVHQVVGDRLDEAGMGLGALVGRGSPGQRPGLVVDIVVALAGAVDAVGPVQARVEPLRRVRRRHLARQHEAHLVEIGAGVGLAVEIAALPAPVGPGAGEAVEDLPGVGLAAGLRIRLGRAPGQPVGDILFRDGFEIGFVRHAGLAEVFLGQDVDGDLGPVFRRLHPVVAEHDGAVRIADLARRLPEGDAVIGIPAFDRELAPDFHRHLPVRQTPESAQAPNPYMLRFGIP